MLNVNVHWNCILDVQVTIEVHYMEKNPGMFSSKNLIFILEVNLSFK